MPEKVYLIAGGTGGIGQGLVKALAGRNSKIYFTYHSSAAKAQEIEKEFAPFFVKALSCDVSRMESVRETVDKVLDAEEGIDVLINAFGITNDKPLVLMSEEDWHSVMDINLTGVFNMTRCVVFSMMKRKEGHIINLSSVSGLHGLPGQTNYAASKAAIIGFSKALAKELAPKKIRVNVIAPGFIETALTDKLDAAYKDRMKAAIPLGRLGTTDDLAGITRYLVSNESSYVTGQVFVLDGGLFI